MEDRFVSRLEHLLATVPQTQEDRLSGEAIAKITSAARGKIDSVHQLVMDLHKALNAMQAEMAEERLDGAAVYGIEDSDRPLIAAFMAGVNRTAYLKFNHPGLGTTATRSGSNLVIQNDIGTTDAHVIVIHCRWTDRAADLHRRARGTSGVPQRHARALQGDMGG